MRRLAIALAAAIAIAVPALAHHGWGSYDAANPITLKGPIRKLEFANPHVHVDLDADGARWELTLAPPFRMNNRGAIEGLLPVGRVITAYGYKSKVRDGEMRAEWIEVEGKRYELR